MKGPRFPTYKHGLWCHNYLPTIMSSLTEVFLRTYLYISMVKRVLALLKTDVRSLIRAASITDSITPFIPDGTLVSNGLKTGGTL